MYDVENNLDINVPGIVEFENFELKGCKRHSQVTNSEFTPIFDLFF